MNFLSILPSAHLFKRNEQWADSREISFVLAEKSLWIFRFPEFALPRFAFVSSPSFLSLPPINLHIECSTLSGLLKWNVHETYICSMPCVDRSVNQPAAYHRLKLTGSEIRPNEGYSDLSFSISQYGTGRLYPEINSTLISFYTTHLVRGFTSEHYN